VTGHRWHWDEDDEIWHCLDCVATDTAYGQPGPPPPDGVCKGSAAFVSRDLPWGHIGEDGGGLDEIVVRPSDSTTITMVHLERAAMGAFTLVITMSDGTGQHVDLVAPDGQPRTIVGSHWEDS